MADPAVCSFITKIICCEGGRSDYRQIPQHLELPDQQLGHILQEAGAERFLVKQQGASCQVLALSPVRLCLRNECEGCGCLHICKNYVRGRCYRPSSGRGTCKYSHEVFSESNRKVLKDHELSGLNEDELRILLLQNDPFLLPDVCHFYNKGDGNCTQKNCSKLHICRYFLRGLCRFPRCKRSHNLLQPKALELLLAGGLDDKLAWNIQTICEHKTAALSKELGPQKRNFFYPRAAASGGSEQSSAANIQTICEHKTTALSKELEPQKRNSSYPRASASGGSGQLSAANRSEHLHEPLSNRPALVDLRPDKGEPVVLFSSGSTTKWLQKTLPPTWPPSPSEHGVWPPVALGTGESIFRGRGDLLGSLSKLSPSSTAPDYSVHPKPAVPGDGGESSSVSCRESRHEPTSDKLPLRPDQGAKATLSPKPSQNAEKKKNDEICLYYVWQFCKHKNNCDMIHYDLPYRWQKYTGIEWKDFDNMEEIEKVFCDPSTTSFPTLNINFGTMLAYVSPVRRLSTPSSVTKPPKFVMTTKWLWYWKNDQGQWIEYGKPDGQRQGSSLSSDDLENVFLADPNGTIQLTAGSQQYEINFKDMIQRNLYYRTQRELRRRPKFVSSKDVKNKKGHVGNAPASTPELNYPKEWDKSALPEIGYKAIELSKTSPEYVTIANLFEKTMRKHNIHKIKRIQNPSLWQVFQWQKEQMKKKRGGKTVDERLLFHGTSSSTLIAICNDNFDWRICGTNGTVFGKGSYFARDAQYSHSYCQQDAKKKTMFVAQVLVGDFIGGNAAYTRPPAKSAGMLNCYDSCVDNPVDPSIFVIFEKHQIYPAYMINYCEEEKKCILS